MTTKKKPNAIKIWMVAATTAEQEEMAALAGTSRSMLYQYVTNRKASSERAAAIEEATKPRQK